MLTALLCHTVWSPAIVRWKGHVRRHWHNQHNIFASPDSQFPEPEQVRLQASNWNFFHRIYFVYMRVKDHAGESSIMFENGYFHLMLYSRFIALQHYMSCHVQLWLRFVRHLGEVTRLYTETWKNGFCTASDLDLNFMFLTFIPDSIVNVIH